jgi:hypothetical protein
VIDFWILHTEADVFIPGPVFLLRPLRDGLRYDDIRRRHYVGQPILVEPPVIEEEELSAPFHLEKGIGESNAGIPEVFIDEPGLVGFDLFQTVEEIGEV